MISAQALDKVAAKFPEILRSPETLKTQAFQTALELLEQEIRPGIIPGLPPSLSGVKTEALKLAKVELRKVSGRLGFLEQLL